MGQPSIEKSAWSKQAMYKRRADTFRPYLLSLLQYSSLSDEVLQRNSFIIASRSVSFDPTSQYRLAAPLSCAFCGGSSPQRLRLPTA